MNPNKPFRFRGAGFWWPVAVALLVVIVAALFNLGGIYLMHSLPAWQAWRAESYGYFLVWRVALYSFVLWGWLCCRARLISQDPEARPGLRRAEVAVVLAFVLMELSRAHSQLGG